MLKSSEPTSHPPKAARGPTTQGGDTTEDDPAVSTPGMQGGLTLTVLWHPDASRIGTVAHTPPAVDLTREAPAFSDGLPLASPRVSRSPVRLVASVDGLELRLGRPDLRASLGAEGASRVPRASLERGVVLELGPVLLRVEPRWTPAARHGHGLVGASRAMDELRRAIEQTAVLEGSVLVAAPTGCGKELVARAVHQLSRRSAAPLVSVNMAALPAGTAAAQLFGHARGAFTGATSSAGGLFGDADGGTIFLDEIGACPLDVQVQLLRALDSGEVQPVGGNIRRVSVRVISATDADLAAAMAAGRFHPALYYRLASGTITIPALRERPADIPVQAVHFMRAALTRMGAESRLTPGETGWLGRDVIRALLAHDWPGNTRELAGAVERLAARSHDRATCEPPRWESAPAAAGDDLSAIFRANRYEVAATARQLGVGVNTLRRRLAAAGLRVAQELGADEVERAVEREGSVEAAAEALGVSVQGLRLRRRQLGGDAGA